MAHTAECFSRPWECFTQRDDGDTFAFLKNVCVTVKVNRTELKIESCQQLPDSDQSRSAGQGAVELTYAPEVQETVDLDKSANLSRGLKEEVRGMFPLAAWQQTR